MTPKRGVQMVKKESKFAYKKKQAHMVLAKDQIKKAYSFAEEYKKFLKLT